MSVPAHSAARLKQERGDERLLPWLGAALCLHLVLGAGVLAWGRGESVQQPPLPIQVSLLDPAPPAPVLARSAPVLPAQPVATPPKPVAKRKPVPSPTAQPQPQPEPLASAPAEVSPAAASTPLSQPIAEAQPSGGGALVEARFDADYLQNPAPVYPPLARRMGEEGKVLVRAYVLPSGRPERVELRQSSGSPRLDEAALAAVRKWRFVPARRAGEAVAAWVVIPITFRLES